MKMVHVNQADKNMDIQFQIMNGNQPFNVPEGWTGTIRGTKGDAFGYAAAVTVTAGSNLVTAHLKEQLTAVAGVGNVFEIIFASTSAKVSTENFILAVEKSALNDETVISESDLVYANQVLNQLQSVAAVNQQVQQNKSNIAAETAARQTADNTLQSNINAEASTRATADASLQSQIDQLVAPSGEAPSAAEVLNARIGADGVTYPTLGDAIRSNDTELKSQLEATNKINETAFSEAINLSSIHYGGNYISANGNLGTSSSWKSYLVNVEMYSLVSVLTHYSTNNAYIAIGFYSSDIPSDTSYISGISFSDADVSNNAECEFSIIPIPTGTKSILICNYTSNGDPVIHGITNGLYETLKQLPSDSINASIAVNLIKYATIGAYYVDANGVLNASGSWVSYLLQVDKFDILEYKGYSNNNNFMAVAFFSSATPSSATYIDGIQFKTGNLIDGRYEFDQIRIPENAVSVLISNRKATSENVSLVGYMVGAIDYLYDSVNDVANMPYEYHGEKITVAPRYNYIKLFDDVGQDGAQYDGVLFRLRDNKTFNVLQLPGGALLGTGTLDGTDTPHCNSVFFSDEFYDDNDPYPILYVNGYNGTDENSARLPHGVLYAFRVMVNGSTYTTTLLQKIDCSGLSVSSYGNFAYDPDTNYIILIDYRSQGNKYSVFARPELENSYVAITQSDVIEEFTDTDTTPNMQGCTFNNGKIYITYGTQNDGHLAVIDVQKKKTVSKVSLLSGGLTFEPEYADIYDGHLLLGGSVIYKMIF